MSLPPPTNADPVAAAGVRLHYTFEEFREASLALERRNDRQERGTAVGATPASPSGRDSRWGRLAIVGCVAALVVLAWSPAKLPGPLAARPNEHYVVRLLAPIGLYFFVAWALRRLARRAEYDGARLPPAPGERRARVVGWAMALAAVVLVPLSLVRGGEISADGQLAHDALLLVVPWVVIFVAGYVRYVDPLRRAGGRLRWSWDVMPDLHLEKTISMDETTFRVCDVRSGHAVRWDGLDGIEETDNVFALISGALFYMLPKRVLTAEQVVFVRNVLLRPSTAKSTGGFEVLPARPAEASEG